jgi:hypothetical protein
MDAAWAVVIGSAIAAFATVAGSPLTAWLTEKAKSRHNHDDQLRAAVDDAVDALIKYSAHAGNAGHTTRIAGEAVLKSASRIGIWLPKGTIGPVDYYLASFYTMSHDPERAGVYAAQIAEILPAWLRGDVKAAVLAQRAEAMKDWRLSDEARRREKAERGE